MADKTKTHKADITISGGGIAGLALAALLGQEGIRVHIIDPAPPKPLGETDLSARTIALMQSSVNVICAANVWHQLSPFATPLRTMRIIDKDERAEFHAREIGLPQFGFNIPNSILRAALFECLAKIKAVVFHKTALGACNVEKNTLLVSLGDGNKIETALLVGADGRNSKVRDLAGIPVKVKDYNQAAITCVVSHTRSHENAASEFHRPHGPLAFVPLPEKKSAVVWIEAKDRAQELVSLRRSDFLRALQDESGGLLGTLTLESNPEKWPLSTSKAQSLIAPRVALMAEAAHVMSPITAQGLNLSLRDVAALAETVIDALRAGIDPGSSAILKKYEKRRTTDINSRVFGVDSMNAIVSTEFGPLKGLRRVGLKAVSNLPPAKKIAMRAGLAPDIDAGRLVQGLPL